MTSLISEPKQRGILIVDDDKTMTDIMESVLRDNGYNNLHTAHDGIAALSILASNPSEIYLILLDIRMPRMDGLSVLKHITNVHSHHVGIIIVTGYGTIELASEFFKMGTEIIMAADFIQKPFNIHVLLKEVETTLDMVHKKRIGHIVMSAEELHVRFDRIEDKIKSVDYLREIRENIIALSKKNHGFIFEIGLDLIRALVIAVALIAFIYLGVGDFLRMIIDRIR